jgi:hypothetical protein
MTYLISTNVLVNDPSKGDSLLSKKSISVKNWAHSVADKYKVYKRASMSNLSISIKLKVKWSLILWISSKKVLTMSFSIFSYANSA